MAASLPPGVDLNTIPTIPPPPGEVSNFVDPLSLFPAQLTVNLIMMLWTTSFVAIRLVTKGRGVGFGDLCCVIGLILSLAYSIMVLDLKFISRHQWNVPLGWILDPSFVKSAYAIGLLSGPGAFFAKTSIFLLYLQIFKVSSAMRYAIYFGMVFNLLLYWPFLLVLSYFCAPIAGVGHVLAVKTECGSLSNYTITQGVAIITLDLYIFVLPLPTILRLQLSATKKYAALAVFMTASLGIVAGICAMAFRIVELHTDDTSWVQAQLGICIAVENYVAVLVSCAPTVSQSTKQYIVPTRFGQFLRSKLLKGLGLSPTHTGEAPPTPHSTLRSPRIYRAILNTRQRPLRTSERPWTSVPLSDRRSWLNLRVIENILNQAGRSRMPSERIAEMLFFQRMTILAGSDAATVAVGNPRWLDPISSTN